MESTDKHTILEDTIKNLYLDAPLFGEILINVQRVWTENVQLAEITNDLRLFINPVTFCQLNAEKRKFILVHNCLHLICDHFFRFKEEYKNENDLQINLPAIVSISIDVAGNEINRFEGVKDEINHKYVQYLIDVAHEMLAMSGQKTGKKVVVKEKEQAEYYYEILLKMVQEIKKSGLMDEFEEKTKCKCKGDDHKISFAEAEKTSNADKMKTESVIKNAIDRQKQHELKRGIGAGDSLVNILPKKVDRIDKRLWKALINKNFGDTPIHDSDFFYGRQSRRKYDSFWGKKRRLESGFVFIGIDTSGSITDEDLSAFVGTINKGLQSCNLTATLIQCDYDIQKVDLNLKRIKKSGIHIHGRGGTDLTKILDYINEKHPGNKKHKLVLLTDGATPWRIEPHIHTTVIYTHNHSKLEGVKDFAVINY